MAKVDSKMQNNTNTGDEDVESGLLSPTPDAEDIHELPTNINNQVNHKKTPSLSTDNVYGDTYLYEELTSEWINKWMWDSEAKIDNKGK